MCRPPGICRRFHDDSAMCYICFDISHEMLAMHEISTILPGTTHFYSIVNPCRVTRVGLRGAPESASRNLEPICPHLPSSTASLDQEPSLSAFRSGTIELTRGLYNFIGASVSGLIARQRSRQSVCGVLLSRQPVPTALRTEGLTPAAKGQCTRAGAPQLPDIWRL